MAQRPRGAALTGGVLRTGSPAIFISYRRGESGGYTGRLSADLRDHYGRAMVFEDIDSIEAGADFPQLLDRVLESCQVLVAVIGTSWLAATDQTGRRRLDDPADWVRLEITAALKRNIPVIPVLVGGASMPPAAELPAPLAGLARRQAIELSDTRWDFDLSRLFDILDRRLGTVPRPIATGETPTVPDGGSRRWLGGLVVLGFLFALAGGGFWVISNIGFGFASPPTLTLSPATAPRGATITVTGTGFQSGETVDVYVHATLVGMAKADAKGAFSKVFTVPPDAPPPDFSTTVHATGESSIRTAQAPFSTRAP